MKQSNKITGYSTTVCLHPAVRITAFITSALFYPSYFSLSMKKSWHMRICILLLIVNFSVTSLVDPHRPTSAALTRISWCFQSVSHFFQTWQAIKQSHHNIFLMKWYYHTDKYPDDTSSSTWQTIYKSKQVSLRFFMSQEMFFLDNLSVNCNLDDKSYFQYSGLL